MLLFVDASSDQDALVLDDEGDASKCSGKVEGELGRRVDASVSLWYASLGCWRMLKDAGGGIDKNWDEGAGKTRTMNAQAEHHSRYSS